jgi:F-box interacting protein
MGVVLVDDVYSLSGENFENSVKLDWTNPCPEDWDLDLDGDPDYSGFGIMGSTSVNGILCVCAFYNSDWKLILWNPTTKEFKDIPSSPAESDPIFNVRAVTPRYHLVGYDRIKDDYKVIRFMDCDGDDDDDYDDDDYDDDDDDDYDDDDDDDYDDKLVSFWEIYSLNSNLWRKIDRKIDVGMPLYFDTKDVYMDGVSHWCDENETHTYLVSFDFGNESFTTTPIPSYMDADSLAVTKDVVILNGAIAFILSYKMTSTVHISILGELGVKESWTKLFVVGPSPCLNYPIVAAKKGKILFRSRDMKQNKEGLVWFDLSTGMIDKIDLTTKISGCVTRCILFHKESILPIGGIYK